MDDTLQGPSKGKGQSNKCVPIGHSVCCCRQHLREARLIAAPLNQSEMVNLAKQARGGIFPNTRSELKERKTTTKSCGWDRITCLRYVFHISSGCLRFLLQHTHRKTSPKRIALKLQMLLFYSVFYEKGVHSLVYNRPVKEIHYTNLPLRKHILHFYNCFYYIVIHYTRWLLTNTCFLKTVFVFNQLIMHYNPFIDCLCDCSKVLLTWVN